MFDLKKFKKTAEDDKTTTLEHEDGHKITVAHKALKPLHREQLKRIKMVDGGDPKDKKEKLDDEPVDSTSAGAQASPSPVSQDTEPVPPTMPKSQPGMQSQTLPAPAPGVEGQTGVGSLGQSFEDPFTDEGLDTAKDKGNFFRAKEAQLAVEQERAQGAAKIEGPSADELNAYHTKLGEDSVDEFNDATLPVAQSIKSIDPNRVWHTAGTGGKVMMALGLLAGASKNSNAHVFSDFVNRQIDRDIDAQRQDIDNKKTLLGYYNTRFRNVQAATLAAKNTMLDWNTMQMKALYDKTGSDAAKAALLNHMQENTAQRYKNSAEGSWIISKDRMDQNAERQEKASEGAQPSTAPAVGEAPTGNPKGPWQYTPILSPDARQKFYRATQDPRLSRSIGNIEEGYNSARLAERSLQDLGPTIDSLAGSVKEGGDMTRLERGALEEHIPFIGSLSGLKGFASVSPSTKDFLANKQNLYGSVFSATRGTNVSPEDVRNVVDNNVPHDQNDTPEQLEQYKRNIDDFIRKHAAKPGSLEAAKMDYKKKH